MDGFVDISKALIGLGPGGIMAGLMFYFWRAEREERREWQRDSIQLLKDKISSDNILAAALNKIADKVAA